MPSALPHHVLSPEMADGDAMSVARDCVSRTWPEVASRLRYPADAEDHFEEVHSALAHKFPSAFHNLGEPELQYNLPGHFTLPAEGLYPGVRCWKMSDANEPTCAPAYEAIWMTHERLGGGFRQPRRHAARRPLLRTVFGSFVPLFVRWTEVLRLTADATVGLPVGSMTPPLIMELQHLLRPDVAYVTAAFDDHGLGTLGAMLPNVVVLGHGGYAHVPLPMFNPLDGHDPLDAQDARALDATALPFASRPMLFSFLGSTYDGPDERGSAVNLLREQMCDDAEAAGAAPPRVNFTLCTTSPQFVEYIHNSSVTLSPRGLGRNALRHADVLRSHNLPVAVYDDIEFVPYRELWPSFAWSTSLRELPAFIRELKGVKEEAYQRRLAALRRLLPTHFTIRGVVEQMRAFPRGRGDLRCQRLPACPQTDCVAAHAHSSDLHAANATLSRSRLDCAAAHAAAALGTPPLLPLGMTDPQRLDCLGYIWASII